MLDGLGYFLNALVQFFTLAQLFNVAWATLLGIAIGMLPGLIGKVACMKAADDDRDTTRTENRRNLISSGSLGCHRGNGHQVGIRRKIKGLYILVSQPDFPRGRCYGSQSGKGERGKFEPQLAPQPSLGPAWRDEKKLHFLFSAIYWAMLRTD